MDVPRPTHAYVPGLNRRHAEGTFSTLRDSARPGMTAEELTRSTAWRAGLDYLDSGYFWEAHELLEPVWMALPAGSDERILVQALIQIANAQLKDRMRRPRAARRLCGIAADLLSGLDGDRPVMGMRPMDLRRGVAALRGRIGSRKI